MMRGKWFCRFKNRLQKQKRQTSGIGEEGKTQHERIRSATVHQPSETTSFGCSPDNLDEILEACKDTATTNGRFWFVRDPDGYKIQLMIKK